MAASLGLRLQATSALLDILRSAACNEKLSKVGVGGVLDRSTASTTCEITLNSTLQEVRSQAEALAEEQSLPWKSLRPIYTALR